MAHPSTARAGARRRPRWLVAMAAALLALGAAQEADAHARLIAGSPRENSLLSASPAAIDLWFNELLDDEFNSIEVYEGAGKGDERKNLASGSAAVNGDDRTHLSVPVQKLGAGVYTVEWKVLSRDGHTARGRFSFRIIPDRDGAY